jgi:hypothetical protein
MKKEKIYILIGTRKMNLNFGINPVLIPLHFGGRIHFFLEIPKLFQKVMTFFEIKYPVFKKFFKNVLEKPKPF